MSAPVVVNLAEKLGSFADTWNPRIVGGYNGNEVRVARIAGDFTWHAHAETDELFFVVKGEIGIEFRGGVVRRLQAGEMLVVPRGTEHRPFADAEAQILLLDRAGEPNTGANPSHLTRGELEVLA